VASCGTTSGYRRGGPDGKGCRCARCKEAYRDARRELRSRSPHERTKTRKVRTPPSPETFSPPAPSNVFAMPSTYQPGPAAGPGPNEMGVLARLDQLKVDDEALRAYTLTLAKFIDRPGDHVSMVIQAIRQLHAVMSELGKGKRTKGRGRLQAVQAMTAENKRTREQYKAVN
jgi:hypothetical protein